jgi:methionine-rich copper-binding protein CopC
MKIHRLIVLLLYLLPQLAMAHSRLLDTKPANGAILQQAPTVLQLNFSTPVENRLNTLEISKVLHDKSTLETTANAHTDWQTLGSEVGGKQVQARLPPLQSGIYQVRWQVLSKDGHVQRGSFSFEVR